MKYGQKPELLKISYRMVSTVKLFVLLIKDVIAQKLNEHTKYFSRENLIINFLKHFKPLLFFISSTCTRATLLLILEKISWIFY